MGLDIHIKGLGYKDCYHSSYIGFMKYRMRIAELYNQRIGELYSKNRLYPLLEEEVEELNKCVDGYCGLAKQIQEHYEQRLENYYNEE